MALTRRELSCLRGSVTLFVALSAIGGGAIFAASRTSAMSADAYHAALAQRRDVEARLAHADREAGELHRRLDLFRELMTRDAGGKEYRSAWLRRITEAADRRRIAALRYELSPRRPLDAALPPGIGGGHEFTASTMKLQLGLRHEEDLLDFLDDVARDARAFVHVRGCDVGRGDGRLDAECTLDWITLRERP